MQKSEGQYPRQSSAERKEALYQDIIDYFDKGKVCIHGGNLYNICILISILYTWLLP